MIDWIKDRLVERTSLDGAALIGVGVIIILKNLLMLQLEMPL